MSQSKVQLEETSSGGRAPGHAAAKSAVVSLAAISLIFLAMLLLYWPALRGGFLWDDLDNVTKPHLRSSSGLERIWFHWGATQTYYPVLHTVYWIEQQLWGDATLGYHLASILFHSISIYLLYCILRRLQIPGAYLAAALFAVHPVYVESVAWITEQKNTLSGVFFLASVLVYLHFDDSRRRRAYAGALALFVLALASKTTAVTLPLALLIILWWKRGRLSWRRDVMPLAPWFALSLLLGMFTNWYERVYVGVQGSEFALSGVQKCLLASRAIWFYLSKLFWPTELTLIYPHWEIHPTDWREYIGLAGLLVVFAGAWIVRGRWPALLAALLLFVGTLFPLLGFFPTYIFRYTYVCDHFQYLPSLAIVVLASAGCASVLASLSSARRQVGRAVCVLVLGTLAMLTWQQCRMYAGQVALYQTMIERNPSCWMAYNNLGILLADSGKTTEAISHYQKALSLHPDYPEALNSLGLQEAKLGQIPAAIENYQHALRIQPNFPGAYVNLGNALLAAGKEKEAMAQFQQALQIDSNHPLAHYNLGNSLLNSGRLEEAIEHYRHAVQFRTDYTDAYFNLGIALARAGKPQEAIEQFEHVIDLKPDYSDAHHNLGSALLDAGSPQKAIEQFQLALQQNPDYAPSYENLAKAYAELHQSANALKAAQHGLELAQLQNRAALAERLETWLTQFRAAQAASKSIQPEPERVGPSP